MGEAIRVWGAVHAVVPDVAGPSKARRFVAETMRQHHVLTRVNDAVLLTSELVTNAIIHGKPPVVVHLQCHDNAVRIEVHDASRGAPSVGDSADLHYPYGGGFAIIDALADDWGVTPVGLTGKAVWFRLANSPLTVPK